MKTGGKSESHRNYRPVAEPLKRHSLLHLLPGSVYLLFRIGFKCKFKFPGRPPRPAAAGGGPGPRPALRLFIERTRTRLTRRVRAAGPKINTVQLCVIYVIICNQKVSISLNDFYMALHWHARPGDNTDK